MASFSSSPASLRGSLSPEASFLSRCAVSVFEPYSPHGAEGAAAGWRAGLSCGQSATGRVGWLPVDFNGTTTGGLAQCTEP